MDSFVGSQCIKYASSYSSSESQKNRQRPIHRQHRFIVQATGHRADLFSRDGLRLIHHHLQRLGEAVQFTRIHGNAKQRRRAQLTGHGQDRYEGCVSNRSD